MNGIQVKIKDVKASNTFDMVKLTLHLITLLKQISLSETELYSLTYFVINGLNTITREELITTKIIKTKNGVANIVSKFRRIGIIRKEGYKDVISSEYQIPTKVSGKDVEAIKIDLIIKK